jgi:hypothetical protein
MAGKQTGIGVTINIDNSAGVAKDISNDITNWDLGQPRGVQDVTGQNQTAMDRLLLLSDGTYNATGVVNPDADKSHSVFNSVATTAVARTVLTDLGTPTVSGEFFPTDYAITRDASGTLIWAVPMVLTGGVPVVWA